MHSDCVFCRIVARDMPAELVYDDGEFVAFRDIHPQAPVHILVVPRVHFASLLDVPDPAYLGRALDAVRAVARAAGLADSGFRTVINTGRAGGQVVMHLHLHVLGGRTMRDHAGG
ncbi:MAG TPA: histidine triad nucleotide-binding protein [Chthonomonadales bacterium]|nr:histidine triad nucleotide-binding protein [Chthonomonadales bacterium]